jgi:hypothetical protein
MSYFCSNNCDCAVCESTREVFGIVSKQPLLDCSDDDGGIYVLDDHILDIHPFSYYTIQGYIEAYIMCPLPDYDCPFSPDLIPMSLEEIANLDKPDTSFPFTDCYPF